jgi:hypothetical protein
MREVEDMRAAVIEQKIEERRGVNELMKNYGILRAELEKE